MVKKANNSKPSAGEAVDLTNLCQQALESLPYAFCVIDVNNHSVRLANSASTLNGTAPTEKCYALLHRRSHPCRDIGEPCPIEIIKRTKKPAVVEHVHYDNEGNLKYFEVHGYPVFDSDGQVGKVIEFSLDVTDRKNTERALREAQADLERRVEERTEALQYANKQLTREVSVRRQTEQALRESEELHRIILSQINDAVLITDDSGVFTYVSPSAQEIFGYTAEEIKAMGDIDHLLGPNLVDASDIEKSGEIQNIKRTVTDKMGRPHTLLVTVKKAIIESGTMLYTCRDVTRLSQAETALKVVNEELQLERETLREKNLALKEILGQIEDEKRRMVSQMHLNMNRMAYPILTALEDKTTPEGEYYLSLLKSCLSDITSPFMTRLETGYSSLTPRELEICHMVKNGFTSKQISAALSTSIETVLKQRKTIRKKLGISNQKVNLVTHLKSLEHPPIDGNSAK